MVVTASPETYLHIIDYGMKKVRLRFDRLLLQAFMAGVFIGMAGNACISFAGSFPTDPQVPGAITPYMQKFIYASIFPTAFIAIIMTGAELFTGNTMTMLICLFERRITIYQLLHNWIGSFLGNWAGTAFSAYFLTYLCSGFDHDPHFSYLAHSAHVKVSYGWGSCFLRGVGCNTWVCLAVWFVVACDEAAGKILALWFPIICFVLSSYEHIIANLYTLQLCAMLGVPTPISDMVVFNLLPTFLGNLVGGCCLIGAVYFYNFYPVIHKQLAHPLPGDVDATATKQDGLRGIGGDQDAFLCSNQRTGETFDFNPNSYTANPSPKDECGSYTGGGGIPRGNSTNSLALSAVPSQAAYSTRAPRESFAGESSTLPVFSNAPPAGGGGENKGVGGRLGMALTDLKRQCSLLSQRTPRGT
ncbi:formate nitrite transporter protein, partial [Cystoisospora suis]